MSESEQKKHADYLFIAELQFRLALAVRLASTTGSQPLVVPILSTYGEHAVSYEEIALRPDQGDFAADFLYRSATFLMAVAMEDAIKATISNPKARSDPNVQSAYQISRLIRNAFAHAPFSPIWSIDPDCRNTVFTVKRVLSLDTTGLLGVPFHWLHHGGPLALFKLGRFVRKHILNDPMRQRKVVPFPKDHLTQMGNLILKKIRKIPKDANPVEARGTKIDLGGGYFVEIGDDPTK